MNTTPRPFGAFPETPRPSAKTGASPQFRNLNGSPQGAFVASRGSPAVRKPLQATDAAPKKEDTVIPLNVVDGPTQRLYAVAFYIATLAWRFYHYQSCYTGTDSTFYFTLWICIDAAFFFGLPIMHIPWLEWSFATTLTIWLLHAIFNFFLMYNIPIPVLAWLGAFGKMFWDRELAISEHRVKPASILQNSSLILGKQIIQILPEGSAVLNPGKDAFCLDTNHVSIALPIRINQTTPYLIELLRTDLENNEQETIILNARKVKDMKKKADKLHSNTDPSTERSLLVPVSKKGHYEIKRVMEKAEMEVHSRSFDTFVVGCPKATISADQVDKCTGELSEINMAITGVAPFKVKYSTQINNLKSSSHVQNVQPHGLESPLLGTLQVMTDPSNPYYGWARGIDVKVPINEVLAIDGVWSYAIDEIEDGLGNLVEYTAPEGSPQAKHSEQKQQLSVHLRPTIYLQGCERERIHQIAQGSSVPLPVKFKMTKPLRKNDWPLVLKYTYAEDGTAPETLSHEMLSEQTVPTMSQSGKYSLDSIHSSFCAGEIREPSVCLVENPPEPNVNLTTHDIKDRCAGSAIGISVDLEFVGTPPFKVRYTSSYDDRVQLRTAEFNGLRGHIDLEPTQAGRHTYEFTGIQDKVYDTIDLRPKGLIYMQDVKPPASASFASTKSIKACLNQPVSIDVRLQGDGPWDLEYEVVHGRKRKTNSVHSEDSAYTITLPDIKDGGQHNVLLTAVTDKSNCRRSIQESVTIDIRSEQSRAGFGQIQSRREVFALEGKQVKLPIRLQGVGPWDVVLIDRSDPKATTQRHHLRNGNDFIDANKPGIYEIVSVHDSCPGVVEPTANVFTVQWLPRPSIAIDDTSAIHQNGRYTKKDICENVEDTLGLKLTGQAPYRIAYQQRSQPEKGSAGLSNKDLSAAIDSASIQMDTTKAGLYTYTFSQLSDNRYNHDKHHFTPLIVQQKVSPLPTARFATPGKTFGHCKDDDSGSDKIGIHLEGSPPFAIEIAVLHHGTKTPEIVKVRDIATNNFLWSLPRRGLALGTHSVRLRSVQDKNGCERVIYDDPSSVRIMVSDPPNISPLETHTDYCVGEHVSYSLSGQPPFEIFYKFRGYERKARSSNTLFRRLAEQPGDVTITALSDSASGKCKASKHITKHIRQMPSVKISKGRTARAEIQEGGEVDILFEFEGTPPFEFTYTRSENANKGTKKPPAILETRTATSNEFSKVIRASDEGTYEVVAIKDKYCAFSKIGGASKGGKSQKLLQ